MPVVTSAWTALLDALFEEPSVGRCLVAPDDTVLRANAEWLRATGFAAEQAIGANVVELFPDTRDMALALYARARGGETVPVPRHVQVIGGRETWWEGSVGPVAMAGGTGLLVTAREVTADVAVRAEREKYRSLFEHSLDAVFLARSDGTIVDANRAACALHGMTLDELRRAGRAGLVVRDERHAAALGARAAYGQVRAEMTARRKDGGTVPVEVESVLLDPGRPDSLAFVISRDVSERRRREEALRAALEELRESEDRFRAVFEGASDAVLLSDPSDGGRVLLANAAATRLFGWSEDELRSLDRTAFLDPADPNVAAFLEARALRPQAGPAELTMLRRDGTRFTGELTSATLRDRTGQPRSVTIVRDVTHRRRAADAVSLSEAVLAQAGAMAHLGAWWIEVSEGRELDANPLRWSAEVYRLFGYAPGEVDVTNALFFAHVHPDDRARVADAVARALATRGRYVIEHRIVRRDGEERVVLEHGEGYHDEAGRLVRVVGAVQDVTDRKRAEHELRESQERLLEYAELVEHAPVLVRDAEDRIVVWNRGMERMCGWTRDVALGKVSHELLRTEFPAPVAEIDAALERTGAWEGELRHRRADGAELVVASRWLLHRDAGGGRRAVVEVNADVTGRRRAEAALREANERLREADRRKDEFLGMLSHELRNPLAPIRNSLYLLDRVEPAGQEARRAKEVANRQVAHLTRLVDDLLDVTRIARGKIELRRTALDLGALARRTADDYRALMDDRGLELEVHVPDEPVLVHGDETRLAQVLGNLLSNAAKFTPGGGRVSLFVSERAGRARVLVRDTGPGIAPEVLPTIFEPFTQGKQTLARSEGGLGLGLALVKGLVALHGGDVEVTTAADGTEFLVTLPLAAPEVRARSAAPHGGPATARRRRVLVIDDNHDAAETLAQLVALLGHEVEVAFDGPGALAAAQARPPDVVLCDLGLPGMDGYEVARRLRAGAPAPTRLVAVSGYAQPEDVARAAEAGFDRHVAKPVDPDRLAAVIA